MRVIGPSWANDILSLLCVSVHGTPVGVIAPVAAEILVIGLSDRVGGSMGCSGCYWCRGGRGCGVVRLAVNCPCAVRIGYKRRALVGSSSFDAVPVTGSLLFYAPVCRLAVCRVAGFSSWELFGGSDCIWHAVFGLFFRRVSVNCVMATDSDAAAGARPGITFDVTLEVPWNAPEAVVHLHSDGVVELDLDTVPDVLGLTGRRLEAAVILVLQGRDERSVRTLIPDLRVMERGFHDVTILDMGDSPEPSLSLDDLSQLRLQWPVTVLRSMQDLDNMRVAAKKRFRNARPGIVPPVGNGLSAICTDIWRHIIWTWASCGGALCPGALCGRARHRTAWITSGGHTMCRGTLIRSVWRNVYRRGLSSARFGWMHSNPAIRGCLLMSCCSANLSLAHHYRVFKRGLPHLAFRKDYLACLWVFVSQATSLAQCDMASPVPPSSVLARHAHPLRWSLSRLG